MLPFAATLLCACMPQETPDFTLAPLFSNGMVLQRDAHAPIWGRGTPGSRVQVEASWSPAARASALVDARGEWRVELETPPAGGPHRLVARAEREIAIEDVLVGEVWLCAGQSNMEWTVGAGPIGGVLDEQKELASADHPRIRHFDVPNRISLHEQREVSGEWVVCSPKTVARFSAVAYFFARELERELDAPVGLLNTTWSGTPIQSWMDERAAKLFAPSAAAFAVVERLRAAKVEPGAAGQLGQGPQPGAGDATVLFNGMVAPLAPYALRGFLWYQGESDRGIAAHYEALQLGLMASWRERFRVPSAPFYYVQIAPYRYDDDRGETGALREAQRRVLASPNCGMAVTLDVGDPGDIHPRNKQDVGKRLARWALSKTYGRSDVLASGPLVREVVSDGEKVRVSFDYVGDGLVSAADHLEGFELVGADGAVWKARAEIVGEVVALWHPECPAPKQVRYGYGDAMQPVLFNKAWLPAAAFCVDVKAPR
jgi:sialate O-acetylesterase